MNNRPKTEQIFILLVTFTVCFALLVAAGCSTIPTQINVAEAKLYTCGENKCVGCGMTCGTIGNSPYLSCQKATGCTRYYLGCIEDGGKIGTQCGWGCGDGCTGCLIGGSSCKDATCLVGCGGCSECGCKGGRCYTGGM